VKALLFESKNQKRSIVVLLPSGRFDPNNSNIAIEIDGDNLRAWILTASESESLKALREIDVSRKLFRMALDYRKARAEYEQKKVWFKDKLFNEMVTSNCDILSFLNKGSVAL